MSDMQTRCLRMCILGGGGYLGQSLAKALQKCGHYVVILDLQFQNFPHIILNPSQLRFIQGSILNVQKLNEALNSADCCFHLAGYGMCGGASLNRQMTMRVNYDGTRAILDACFRLGVPRLIYAGSISVVYRNEEMHYSDESAPYAETFANPYAESKCLAEKAILAANQQDADPKLSTCVLRFRGIYGPGELRTTQRTINLGLSGLVVAKFRKSPTPRTQYSSAENCVNAFILAEESLRVGGLKSKARGQVYNIVDGGDPVDPFGFWEPLITAVGGRVPNIYVPFWLISIAGWLFEMMYYMFGIEPLFTRFEANLMATTNTFSIEKARRDLNYRPVRNHDMAATIQFCQQQQRAKRYAAPPSPPKLNGKGRAGVICALDFAAMLAVVHLCASLFSGFTLPAKIAANTVMLAAYFGVVALRYRCMPPAAAAASIASVDPRLLITLMALGASVLSVCLVMIA